MVCSCLRLCLNFLVDVSVQHKVNLIWTKDQTKTLRWFTPIFSVRQASPRETVPSLLQPAMHSGLKALSYFHPTGYFWLFSTQNASLARGKLRSNQSIVWETGCTPVCLFVASPWRLSIVPDFLTVLENGELADHDLSEF